MSYRLVIASIMWFAFITLGAIYTTITFTSPKATTATGTSATAFTSASAVVGPIRVTVQTTSGVAQVDGLKLQVELAASDGKDLFLISSQPYHGGATNQHLLLFLAQSPSPQPSSSSP